MFYAKVNKIINKARNKGYYLNNKYKRYRNKIECDLYHQFNKYITNNGFE
nr:MAG TPA: hypothetical protein [Caudoviricetes sp.]